MQQPILPIHCFGLFITFCFVLFLLFLLIFIIHFLLLCTLCGVLFAHASLRRSLFHDFNRRYILQGHIPLYWSCVREVPIDVPSNLKFHGIFWPVDWIMICLIQSHLVNNCESWRLSIHVLKIRVEMQNLYDERYKFSIS